MATKPTPRQLRYLRSLAQQTGQTFTYPHTSAQASREITRLKQARPSSYGELEIEREIADAVAVGEQDAARVRDEEISGHGSSATWAHNRHQEPTPSSDRPAPNRSTPVVGKRTELARYTVAEGERVLYGQRVDGVVSFQPGESVVLGAPPANSEDSMCRPREVVEPAGRPDAARPKRPNDDAEDGATAEPRTERRGRTGPRVELARYVISAGERVLYGQRVWGVVRVTDVPLKAGGRAYLVERGLEEDGNLALQALVADYVRQAERLDEVPMAFSLL